MIKMNPMKQIRMEKLTLNVGAGTNQELLKKGMKLLKNLAGIEPIKTISEKRIPAWGVRPGLPVGCKLTLRGEKKIAPLLKRFFMSKENKIPKRCFDDKGNLSFGIHEYINVPDLAYDPSIGIMGFEFSVTVTRPGYRIKKRRKLTRPVGKAHQITQQESIDFFKENFHIVVEED
jgi:large subunit ribosomal protein L5